MAKQRGQFRAAAPDTLHRLRLRILSDPANLAAVRKSIEELAIAGGFDSTATGELALCVNEALANVMRHAYRGAVDRPIDVVAELTREGIQIRIRDWGSGVNPDARPLEPHDPPDAWGTRFNLPAKNDGPCSFFSAAGRNGFGDDQKEKAMSQISTGSTLVPTARREGNVVIAQVHGEIDLHNSPELREALLNVLLKDKPQKLVLNLSQVPYMDSSAIAVLVESLRKLQRSGGRIFLTNLQPRVRGLLEIARLNAIFSIVPDEADALKA